MNCINCGHGGVEQTGDMMRCPTCGYEWDVEFENQHPTLARIVGRFPVKSPSQIADESRELVDALLTFKNEALRNLAEEKGVELTAHRKNEMVSQLVSSGKVTLEDVGEVGPRSELDLNREALDESEGPENS